MKSPSFELLIFFLNNIFLLKIQLNGKEDDSSKNKTVTFYKRLFMIILRQHHFNIFHRGSKLLTFLKKRNSFSVNIDINPVTCCTSVKHRSISDSQITSYRILTDQTEQKKNRLTNLLYYNPFSNILFNRRELFRILDFNFV